MLNYLSTIIKNFYCLMMDINVNQYDKILEHQNRYLEIKSIAESSLEENNIIKNILIKYLYGDFIILVFEDDLDHNILIFEDINYEKSKLLRYFFEKKNFLKKNKYKIHLNYEKKYLNFLLKYLIYSDNSINNSFKYNNGLISCVFEDNFLNQLIFNLNYEELIDLQMYIDYFEIQCLDTKISVIINLIKNAITEKKGLINVKEVLSTYL
ncbi:uncharacterized protein METZ01_LOCUS70750 [marine metagenome]|uniref:Uncharacterized protein n=1 Tax=marine metagenome TaxID=408172 RepID=A0A381TP91_9ZZZZ